MFSVISYIYLYKYKKTQFHTIIRGALGFTSFIPFQKGGHKMCAISHTVSSDGYYGGSYLVVRAVSDLWLRV